MPRPEKPRRRGKRLVIGLVIVAAVLVGVAALIRQPEIIESLPLPDILRPDVVRPQLAQQNPPAPALPTGTTSTTLYPPPGPMGDTAGLGEEAAPEPPPPLGESDGYVAGLVRGLSGNPKLAAWLATGSIVRRFVGVVDNVADGEDPRPHVPFLAPETEFKTATIASGRLVVDPRSYDRYDGLADAVASVDTHGAVELYRQIRPLADDAYRELGRNDRALEDALCLAIRRVLTAPIIEGDVALVPRVISFGYADPRLQNLGPVEKQLVRLGPRNLHLVQERARAFATELGIPACDLPATPQMRTSDGRISN